jgi:hypothetical protein
MDPDLANQTVPVRLALLEAKVRLIAIVLKGTVATIVAAALAYFLGGKP